MTEYRTVAYAEALPNGQAAGTLSFTSATFAFTWPGGQKTGALSGLSVRLDGDGRKYAFFTHPDLPGWQMLLMDAAGLADPAIATHPDLAATAHKAVRLAKKIPTVVKAMGWMVVAGIALLAFLWFNLKSLAQKATAKIPKEVEVALGEAVAAQFLTKVQGTPDPAHKGKLDRATARLLPVVNQHGYEFKFHIIKDSSLNAFAIPGGQVFVHTGLLDAATRPEQVAGVLAHEIAHVTRQHSLRNMVESAGLGAIVSILFGGADAGTLVSAGEWLLQQKYSRDTEREADEYGWKYLVESKTDPAGLLEFFEKLKAQEGALNGVPDVISTHPATEERVSTLRKWLTELPPDFKPTPL
jgi:predicted Zn-dependent protease